MTGSMMDGWLMGGLAILIMIVLAAVALIKYLFSSARRDD